MLGTRGITVNKRDKVPAFMEFRFAHVCAHVCVYTCVFFGGDN